MAGDTLQIEMRTYEKHLPEWQEHEGAYVLIHGTEVNGFFDSYTEALKSGYDTFGLQPFLVKQVSATEKVQFISRLYAPRMAGGAH